MDLAPYVRYELIPWLETALIGAVGLGAGIWFFITDKHQKQHITSLSSDRINLEVRLHWRDYLWPAAIDACVASPCLEGVAFRSIPAIFVQTHQFRWALATGLGLFFLYLSWNRDCRQSAHFSRTAALLGLITLAATLETGLLISGVAVGALYYLVPTWKEWRKAKLASSNQIRPVCLWLRDMNGKYHGVLLGGDSERPGE